MWAILVCCCSEQWFSMDKITGKGEVTKAFRSIVSTTELKGIFVVNVCPWYIIGYPSSPSQQSSSTHLQPVSKTWKRNNLNPSVLLTVFCLNSRYFRYYSSREILSNRYFKSEEVLYEKFFYSAKINFVNTYGSGGLVKILFFNQVFKNAYANYDLSQTMVLHKFNTVIRG